MDMLPDELLELALSRLDVDSLVAVHATSRRVARVSADARVVRRVAMAGAAAQIAKVLRSEPFYQPRWSNEIASFVRVRAQQFVACKLWIRRNMAPRKSFNHLATCYSLKHDVERANPLGGASYVSPSMFRAAAVHLGFRMGRNGDYFAATYRNVDALRKKSKRDFDKTRRASVRRLRAEHKRAHKRAPSDEERECLDRMLEVTLGTIWCAKWVVPETLRW